MKNYKKLFVGTLSALCVVLAAFCAVLAVGWSRAVKTAADLPAVRNNGAAIQWKYTGNDEWHDLVALDELRGAAGENGTDGSDGQDGVNGKDGADGRDGINGKDGINGADGVDGKNGADGKKIEVQRADSYIQWRYDGGEWQNLVAIADIAGPSGQNGADGANGKTPEFRVNENTLQWRYSGDEIWLNLYDLSVLKGADGKDGLNGKDGVDGKDGDKGEKGDQGEKGDKGEKGDRGDNGETGPAGPAGKDGSCTGWFYGEGHAQSVLLQNGAITPYYQEKMSSGGLVSCDGYTFKLKKGHNYNVCISGSVYAMTNDDSGNYSVQMTDGYDDAFCRELTRITVDGRKLSEPRREQHALEFNRVYNAKDDITLKFSLEQSNYKTYLLSFRCTVTITALD